MSFKCEILADSLSPQGHRLTTMKVTFPRFILAEFNTHRMFSRNSASSRAIPFKKMVKMVEENPFIPMAWQKDHKGMQGTEYLFADQPEHTNHPKWGWLRARDEAVKAAIRLSELEVTKQLVNRLLEPFMWHTVIVTATEWENFFKLRCPQYHTPVSGEGFYFRSKKDCVANHSDPDNISKLENMTDLEWLQINTSQAEIHIQAIAELMWDAYNESKPKQLQAGEWHIPFGDNFQHSDLLKVANLLTDTPESLKVKIAVARCARISYETLGDNPKIDYEADLKLYNILANSGHWSPFEHVARVMNKKELDTYINGVAMDDFGGLFSSTIVFDESNHGWCRNFKGFIQYRSLIDN